MTLKRSIASLGLLLLLGACAAARPQAPTTQAEPPPAVAATAGGAGSGDAPAGEPPAISEGRSIFFAPGSAELDAAARRALEPHAARLRDDPQLVVTLIGHTDPLGSRSYNLALTEQRVSAVVRALRAMDVRSQQIRRNSLGRENAGFVCQTEACRRKLRRVDLIYPGTPGK